MKTILICYISHFDLCLTDVEKKKKKQQQQLRSNENNKQQQCIAFIIQSALLCVQPFFFYFAFCSLIGGMVKLSKYAEFQFDNTNTKTFRWQFQLNCWDGIFSVDTKANALGLNDFFVISWGFSMEKSKFFNKFMKIWRKKYFECSEWCWFICNGTVT